MLELGGAVEEIVCGTHHGVQLRVAAADAFDVQDVVNQPDEAVSVPDGDLQHLFHFFRTGVERAAGDEAKRGPEAGQRRPQLMGDGGDELILHAVELAAFRGVSERDDDTDGAAGTAITAIDLRPGYVVDGEVGSVLAPEDLIGDPDCVHAVDGLS